MALGRSGFLRRKKGGEIWISSSSLLLQLLPLLLRRNERCGMEEGEGYPAASRGKFLSKKERVCEAMVGRQ